MMANKGGCLGCKNIRITLEIDDDAPTANIQCIKQEWNAIEDWSGFSDEKDAYVSIIVRGSTCKLYEKADHVSD